MAERELTDAEREFLEETLASPRAHVTREGKSKKRRRVLPRFLRPRFWAIVLTALTLLVVAVFLYVVYQIPATFGGIDALRLLNGLSTSEEWGMLPSQVGLGWVTDFMRVYDSKEIISAVIITVGLGLALLLWIVDLLTHKKQEQ